MGVWGSFLIAAAALRTPTINGFNAQGVNLTFLVDECYTVVPYSGLQGALCAKVIRPRVSNSQNNETRSRNSLRYLREAN